MSSASAEKNGNVARLGAGTQSIRRTLAVLGLFRDRRRDLGISEIADELSLSASTVHRIVRALTSHGYLAQHNSNDRYYLGRSAVLLGQAAHQTMGLHLAQSVLDRVAEETGESVNLGVREADEMVVLISTQSKQALRFAQEPGSRLPVHATSMGKATLAYGSAPSSEAVAALAEPLEALTSRTITTTAALREELERIRRRGYSIDDEEAIVGVRCIAAPLFSAQGNLLAAVAIQGPAVRMSRSRLKSLAPLLLDAAQEIERILPQAHPL